MLLLSLFATSFLCVGGSSMETPIDRFSVDRDLKDAMMCRCEASWESMYLGRRALEVTDGERQLFHHYAYDEIYIDRDGYWHVDGVKVMPSNSEYCGSYTEQRNRHHQSIFNRNLVEQNFYENVVEVVETQGRRLRQTNTSRRAQCKYIHRDGECPLHLCLAYILKEISILPPQLGTILTKVSIQSDLR